MKKPFIFLMLLLLVVAATLLAIYLKTSNYFHRDKVEQNKKVADADKQLWTCGMHPQVVQDHPGDCPICHMRLTPMHRHTDANHTGPPVVVIDPAVVQNMGVRTADVTRGPLIESVQSVGTLEAPESGLHDINLKVNGWIEKLYANQEGQHVHQGDPLFDLYSPDLLIAGQELVGAVKSSDQNLIASARRKLALLDVPQADIDTIAQKLVVPRTITFRSPASGAVIDKAVVEGSAVQAGAKLMRIEDHGTLWLDLQIYEDQMALVAVGQSVDATIAAWPGRMFHGTITFIHPHVDHMSRTLIARAILENDDFILHPGMYASATIQTRPLDDAIQVPREAVIDTGTRQVAFVVQSNGHFEPRNVRMGITGNDGRVQILDGLAMGEQVVTSGQFLLDVESRTTEAIDKLRAASTPAMNQMGGDAMITKIIEWSVKNKALVLLMTAALLAAGIWAAVNSSIDAVPDLSDVQVIVVTDYAGQAPQVVEDQVTYPLTTALMGIPHAKAVRGQSMFETSMIYVIFDEGTDLYWARSRVLEFLNVAKNRLPANVEPKLGPDATGVGWVYQYMLYPGYYCPDYPQGIWHDESEDHWYTDPMTAPLDRRNALTKIRSFDKPGNCPITGKPLVSCNQDLASLRSLQDWYLRYQLTAVPGVAEVASIGGFVKEYQVVLKPDQLLAYKLPIRDIMMAVQRSNNDVGGSVVEMSENEYMVRSRGYLKGLSELAQVPVGVTKENTPIYLSDVATLQIAGAERRGVGEWNGQGEAVGGVVVARFGSNAYQVIHDAKAKLADLEMGLPPGVSIKTSYDRSDLIERSVHTLRHTLVEEMIVVGLVCIVFLLHARSELVAIFVVPTSVLTSLLVMHILGINANIMSLGGIAIAVGVVVDSAIVMVENAHKHLDREEERVARGQAARPRSQVICRRSHRSRPEPVFQPVDHHRQFPADLRSHRRKRAVVQTARAHKNVCDGIRVDPVDHDHSSADGLFHHAKSPAQAVGVLEKLVPDSGGNAASRRRVLLFVRRISLVVCHWVDCVRWNDFGSPANRSRRTQSNQPNSAMDLQSVFRVCDSLSLVGFVSGDCASCVSDLALPSTWF